jgi:hypothetical protein
MQPTMPRSIRRVTAKEVIDLAHVLSPAIRTIDNRVKGRVLRAIIVDGDIGVILEDRARFERLADKESPVDTAVYEVPADTEIEALARALTARLLRS